MSRGALETRCPSMRALCSLILPMPLCSSSVKICREERPVGRGSSREERCVEGEMWQGTRGRNWNCTEDQVAAGSSTKANSRGHSRGGRETRKPAPVPTVHQPSLSTALTVRHRPRGPGTPIGTSRAGVCRNEEGGKGSLREESLSRQQITKGAYK